MVCPKAKRLPRQKTQMSAIVGDQQLYSRIRSHRIRLKNLKRNERIVFGLNQDCRYFQPREEPDRGLRLIVIPGIVEPE